MRFERAILKDWLQSLIASTDAKDRCIGQNFLIEENVSDERRLELEAHNPELTDVEILFKSYYRIFVQGEIRGHVPSTFEMHKNFPALKAVAVHPARKLMRLECLDEYLLLEQDGFEFEQLNHAVKGGSPGPILELLKHIHRIPGERPMFSGYMSDIRSLLKKKDWLPRIIDFWGLHHHYPYDPEKPNRFGLFEYTAAEVIEQASRKGIRYFFALPTVLEAWNSPAFCPVPSSSGQGRIVNLRGNGFVRPAHEILHPRFDYSARNLIRVGVWHGAMNPDIVAACKLHLDLLRRDAGCPDFGAVGKAP